MNPIQEQVLRKLSMLPGSSFAHLRQGESNAFSYHLKQMKEAGLVRKEGDGYVLTDKGREASRLYDTVSGEKELPPVVAALTVVQHEGKLLVQKRLKEPFFGYHSFPCGRLKVGEDSQVGCSPRIGA